MNAILMFLSFLCVVSSIGAFFLTRYREPVAGAFFIVLAAVYAFTFVCEALRLLDVWDVGWIRLAIFRVCMLGGLWYIAYTYHKRHL